MGLDSVCIFPIIYTSVSCKLCLLGGRIIPLPTYSSGLPAWWNGACLPRAERWWGPGVDPCSKLLCGRVWPTDQYRIGILRMLFSRLSALFYERTKCKKKLPSWSHCGRSLSSQLKNSHHVERSRLYSHKRMGMSFQTRKEKKRMWNCHSLWILAQMFEVLHWIPRWPYQTTQMLPRHLHKLRWIFPC